MKLFNMQYIPNRYFFPCRNGAGVGHRNRERSGKGDRKKGNRVKGNRDRDGVSWYVVRAAEFLPVRFGSLRWLSLIS